MYLRIDYARIEWIKTLLLTVFSLQFPVVCFRNKKFTLVVPMNITARSVSMGGGVLNTPERLFDITFERVEQSTRFSKYLMQNIIPRWIVLSVIWNRM